MDGPPCLQLSAGDKLGVYIKDVPSSAVFTYDFNHASTLSHTFPDTTTDGAAVGDQVEFDALPLPLKLSLMAAVYIGEWLKP